MIDLFFLLGAILLLGFFSYEFFQLTKIPDTLILITLGILIGPVFGLLEAPTGAKISSAAPFIGNLALIIILFDGGLNLKASKVMSDLRDATAFTLSNFLFSMFGIGALMHFYYGWSPVEGLLLGAMLGGIASAVVMTIMCDLDVTPDVRTILSLESAFSDVICVVTTLVLVAFLKTGAINFQAGLALLSNAFSTAIMTGIIFAALWIAFLHSLGSKDYGYILTIAVLFMLFSVTELLGGDGAIASLVFGLVFGNIGWISKKLDFKGDYRIEKGMIRFQNEISFFVRTYFFVYLGMIFDPYAVTTEMFIQALGVTAVMLLGRSISVKLFTKVEPQLDKSALVLVVMLPLGVVAAVLSRSPAQIGVLIPNLSQLVSLLIILTNVVTTIGVFFYENSIPRKETSGA